MLFDEKLIRSAERLYDACLGGYVVVFYFISYGKAVAIYVIAERLKGDLMTNFMLLSSNVTS